MEYADLPGRDAQGNWKPEKPIELPAFPRWPFQPVAFLKWLFGFPGFLWPYKAVIFGLTAVTWFFLTPPLETMATLRPGWIALILLRNVALITVWYSIFHVRLHIQRAQGLRYKFNNRWLAEKSRAFFLGGQTADNVFYSIVSGGGIWSAYEVFTLWAYANDLLPFMAFRTSPVAFVLLFLTIPFFRAAHFYVVHRLMHWKPLYKAAHYVHHRNVNVGPWSGISMHPIESLIYFSYMFVHLIVPSHPLHAIFHLQYAGLSPAQGHTGFSKMELGHEKAALAHGSYFHYLHHRYFECNYASDEDMFLDKLFGSMHDGTAEAHAKMRARAHERIRERKIAAESPPA